jgi:hypothetical protein
MLFSMFIVIIFVEVLLALKFSKMARLTVDRSNAVGAGIFGRTYHSVLEIYMDFNFLNDLFDGKAIKTVSDDELSINLSTMRKVLIGQIVGGLLFFLFGIALGLSS